MKCSEYIQSLIEGQKVSGVPVQVSELDMVRALHEKEVGAAIAGCVKVAIPTATMEQEFSRHYRHGYMNGAKAEREALAKHFDTERGGSVLTGDEVAHEIRARSN